MSCKITSEMFNNNKFSEAELENMWEDIKAEDNRRYEEEDGVCSCCWTYYDSLFWSVLTTQKLSPEFVLKHEKDLLLFDWASAQKYGDETTVQMSREIALKLLNESQDEELKNRICEYIPFELEDLENPNINFRYLSNNTNIKWTDEILDKYKDKLNWWGLANCIQERHIEKYSEHINNWDAVLAKVPVSKQTFDKYKYKLSYSMCGMFKDGVNHHYLTEKEKYNLIKTAPSSIQNMLFGQNNMNQYITSCKKNLI